MKRVDIKVCNWNNITDKQLIRIAALFREQPEELTFNVKAFMILTDLRLIRKQTIIDKDGCWRWFKDSNRKILINLEEINWVIKKFDWLTNSIQLPNNIKTIGKYRGTDRKIYTVTLQQYLTADIFYNGFSVKQKIEFLNKFVGCLYLKRGEVFNPESVNKYGKRFMFKSNNVKIAVYLWFTGVKEFLKNKYPNLFSGADDAEPGQDPSEIFLNTLSSLNDGDITRNPKLLNSPVHEAFKQLDVKLEQIKDLENV